MIYATQMPHVMGTRGLEPKHPELSDPGSMLRRDMEGRFGSLIWVLPPNAAPWTPGVMDTLRDGVKGYTRDDYLLCLGNPILLSMMVTFACQAQTNEQPYVLRFLQWSKYDGYKPLTVEL